MSMSAHSTQESLTYFFTGDALTGRPVAWEVSLHTDNPGQYGGDYEVYDAAYTRQSVTFALDTGGSVAAVANAAPVVFPAALVPYEVSHIVVWGDGQALDVQRLVTNKTIGVGVQAQFATGDIQIGGSQ